MSGWETWGVHLSLIIPVLVAEGVAQSAAAALVAQAFCALLHSQSVPAAPPDVAWPFLLGSGLGKVYGPGTSMITGTATIQTKNYDS